MIIRALMGSKVRESYREGPFSVAFWSSWLHRLGSTARTSSFRHVARCTPGSSLVLSHSLSGSDWPGTLVTASNPLVLDHFELPRTFDQSPSYSVTVSGMLLLSSYQSGGVPRGPQGPLAIIDA